MTVAERLLPSHRRWAAVCAIACVVAGQGPPAPAAARARNVLVLYSNGRLLPANIDFDRGLRAATLSALDRPVELFDEFPDVPRASGQACTEVFATYLRGKYTAHAPDVIVAVSLDALRFVLVNRMGLYPGGPVVHAAVSPAELRTVPALRGDVVGVPFDVDFTNTVEQALRWHRRARRLVIVTGAAEWDRQWEARLRAEVSRFADAPRPSSSRGCRPPSC